jgi:hypothetical protein
MHRGDTNTRWHQKAHATEPPHMRVQRDRTERAAWAVTEEQLRGAAWPYARRIVRVWTQILRDTCHPSLPTRPPIAHRPPPTAHTTARPSRPSPRGPPQSAQCVCCRAARSKKQLGWRARAGRPCALRVPYLRWVFICTMQNLVRHSHHSAEPSCAVRAVPCESRRAEPCRAVLCRAELCHVCHVLRSAEHCHWGRLHDKNTIVCSN